MPFPKVIYFCNKTLDKMEVHAANWKCLNPDYEIKLFDNPMCEQFLLETFGPLHRDIFLFLEDGPIKADFWRVCVLYTYGGVYSDIDNQPFVPIDEFLEPSADFLTCSSYWDAMRFVFNPNFIIANKGCSILKAAIDWYITKYTRKDTYKYWDYSIMRCFTDTLHLTRYAKEDGIYMAGRMKVQILKECRGRNHYDAHNLYKGRRIFNNRYESWDCHTHAFR